MPKETSSRYLPYVDGLRGIAISLVVLSHAGLHQLIPGKLGVTLFFFISGFLITSLLLDEKEKTGHIHLYHFYLRRFFRLYPALLCMIGISIAATVWLKCSLTLHDIIGALFYYSNYYIGWYRLPVEDCSRILDILWSLSVEEHFYLLYPFLFGMLIQNHTREQLRRFIWILLALCITAILFRWQIYTTIKQPEDVAGRIYFSSHTRMDSILWGCLCALISRSNVRFYQQLQQRTVGFIGFVLIIASLLIPSFLYKQLFQFTTQGIGLFLLLPSLQTNGQNLILRALTHPWLIFIGKISYSLYLFHWVAAKVSTQLLTAYGLYWQLCFWSMVIILTLSSYYLVELPFVSLRKKFGSQMK
jgi:peptidoglycan/LPS O-acetylase OafA/YrhL